MDLGIAGRRALVCAASKGLGYACAEALAAEGEHEQPPDPADGAGAVTTAPIRTASRYRWGC